MQEQQEKIKMIVPSRGTGWTPFKGTELPEKLQKLCDDKGVFQSGHGSWLLGTVYYRGDIETTREWVVVLDDGGYYKVFAEYAFWHPSPLSGDLVLQCVWSERHLKKTMSHFLKTGQTLGDPGYQT